MPAVKLPGFAPTRICGTMEEDASLSPFKGNADNHGPPESVPPVMLKVIWPTPVFRMLKNWGGAGPPPCTAKNVRPVCGIRMVCRTADTVIVTGTTTLCARLVLEIVTVPE